MTLWRDRIQILNTTTTFLCLSPTELDILIHYTGSLQRFWNPGVPLSNSRCFQGGCRYKYQTGFKGVQALVDSRCRGSVLIRPMDVLAGTVNTPYIGPGINHTNIYLGGRDQINCEECQQQSQQKKNRYAFGQTLFRCIERNFRLH